MREQPLLNDVLQAARRERCATLLLLFRQLLAQPRHRAIEMMLSKAQWTVRNIRSANCARRCSGCKPRMLPCAGPWTSTSSVEASRGPIRKRCPFTPPSLRTRRRKRSCRGRGRTRCGCALRRAGGRNSVAPRLGARRPRAPNTGRGKHCPGRSGSGRCARSKSQKRKLGRQCAPACAPAGRPKSRKPARGGSRCRRTSRGFHSVQSR